MRFFFKERIAALFIIEQSIHPSIYPLIYALSIENLSTHPSIHQPIYTYVCTESLWKSKQENGWGQEGITLVKLLGLVIVMRFD